MKKVFISASIIVSSLFGFQSFAQNADSNKQCENKQCEKQCGKVDCNREGRRMTNLFEGITLSTDQQKKIEAIKAENKKKHEENRKEKMENRNMNRREFLDQIKSILTPEQYTTFLENSFLNNMPRHRMGPQGDRRKHGNKDFRGRDHKNARPDRKMSEK